ncbi:MAG: T9SS type A sorting domain-containing protein [Aureispira sp.]|nr:T9SS type A sorting domain-containing protein [Aureispira sp.]
MKKILLASLVLILNNFLAHRSVAQSFVFKSTNVPTGIAYVYSEIDEENYIEVKIGVENNSTIDADIGDTITIYWDLATDAQGTNYQLVGKKEIILTQSFNAGSYAGTTTIFDIPSNLAAGNYYLFGYLYYNGAYQKGLKYNQGTGPDGTIPVQQLPTQNPVENLPDNISYLDVYPNPNNGQFNIHYELEKPAKTTILISNIVGKTVKLISNLETSVPGEYNQQIDLTGLPTGTYFYTLVADNKKARGKILITQ